MQLIRKGKEPCTSEEDNEKGREVKMKKALLLTAILGMVSLASAHFELFEESMTLGNQKDLIHYDADPWKGLITLNVTNTGSDPWGDFHFQLSGEGAFFSEEGTATDIPGAIWTVTPTTVDFYFYSNPVEQGESASFTVYTNNPNMMSFFTLCVSATPVPEPATLALMGLGGLALIRRK